MEAASPFSDTLKIHQHYFEYSVKRIASVRRSKSAKRRNRSPSPPGGINGGMRSDFIESTERNKNNRRSFRDTRTTERYIQFLTYIY